MTQSPLGRLALILILLCSGGANGATANTGVGSLVGDWDVDTVGVVNGERVQATARAKVSKQRDGTISVVVDGPVLGLSKWALLRGGKASYSWREAKGKGSWTHKNNRLILSARIRGRDPSLIYRLSGTFRNVNKNQWKGSISVKGLTPESESGSLVSTWTWNRRR